MKYFEDLAEIPCPYCFNAVDLADEPAYYSDGEDNPAVCNECNKEFAKALWGESKSIKGNEPWQTLGWEHHLKNMVVAEDPIEYLAENLD